MKQQVVENEVSIGLRIAFGHFQNNQSINHTFRALFCYCYCYYGINQNILAERGPDFPRFQPINISGQAGLNIVVHKLFLELGKVGVF